MSDETEVEETAPTVRESIDEARGIEPEQGPIGEQVTTEEEVVTCDAPDHWSQLDKDRFNDLPDDIKPLWLEKSKSLETGYNEKFEQIAEWTKERDRLEQIFQPLASELSLYGTSRADAIERLVGAHQLLSRDPEAGMRWLAEQYGAQHLLAGQESQDDFGLGDFQDPAIAEINTLKQQLAKLTGVFGQFQGSQQQQQHTQAQMHVDAFAAATDEAGKPRYPYFNEVRQTMGQLFQVGAVSTLDEAYAKAVRMNDEVFERVNKASQAEQQAAADAKRKEEAQKARRASDARVVTSGKGGGESAKHNTLRGALEAAVRAG